MKTKMIHETAMENLIDTRIIRRNGGLAHTAASYQPYEYNTRRYKINAVKRVCIISIHKEHQPIGIILHNIQNDLREREKKTI